MLLEKWSPVSPFNVSGSPVLSFCDSPWYIASIIILLIVDVSSLVVYRDKLLTY